MQGLMNSFKRNLLQWIALVVLLLAMGSASKRALVSIFLPVFRVIWPFLVLWIGYRFVRGKIEGGIKKFQDQIMSQVNQAHQARGGGAGAGGGQVLDLCSKCGALDSPQHKC
jgi:hypothetical protein